MEMLGNQDVLATMDSRKMALFAVFHCPPAQALSIDVHGDREAEDQTFNKHVISTHLAARSQQ